MRSDAEHRLGRFRDERAAIAATVRERVCGEYLARAAAGGRSLASVLGAVAAAMLGGAGEGRDRREAIDWQAIARRCEGATEPELRQTLAAVVDYFLADIGGGFDRRAFRLVIASLPAALRFAFSPGAREPLEARLQIDGPLDELRELGRRDTLVIAPTHSSNLDSLVLGLALARVGLPPCVYATAKHMYRNRLVAGLVRRLGAYRVDRGLRLDLYLDVIAAYATVVLERGFHTVVFPGATRCRTNEVEPSLKLGLLRSATRAQRHRPEARIWIVPVAINYQVVLEAEWLIRYYLAGRAGERIVGDELLAWGRLTTSLRRLSALDQSVAIRFGAPIEPQDTRRLAGVLTEAYRRATVLFSTHVTARAVFDLASRRTGTVDVQELVRRRGELTFAADEVHDQIGRVIAMIRSRPEGGSLHRDLAGMEAGAIVRAAGDAWGTCHRTPPVTSRDGRVAVADAGLLFFYRNRTSHVAA